MDRLTAQDIIIDWATKTPGRPNLVLPDDAEHLPAPRWVADPSSGPQGASGLDGGTEGQAEVVFRVETSTGNYAVANRALVDMLVARFLPLGLRVQGLTFKQPPDVRPPFEDGGNYIRPVVIRGWFWS